MLIAEKNMVKVFWQRIHKWDIEIRSIYLFIVKIIGVIFLSGLHRGSRHAWLEVMSMGLGYCQMTIAIILQMKDIYYIWARILMTNQTMGF